MTIRMQRYALTGGSINHVSVPRLSIVRHVGMWADWLSDFGTTHLRPCAWVIGNAANGYETIRIYLASGDDIDLSVLGDTTEAVAACHLSSWEIGGDAMHAFLLPRKDGSEIGKR